MQQSFIKGAAAMLAACVLLGSMSALPAGAAGEDAFLLSDGFESGSADWESRGGSTVAVSTSCPYSGSSSLYVSGRSAEWNGAQKDVSSLMTPGSTSSLSACMRYDGTAKSVNFMLSLHYTDANDKTVYDHIANAETISGF